MTRNYISGLSEINQDTIALFEKSARSPLAGDPRILNKAITQSTGLVWYDLQTPAKNLFPVITPLRNKIPRVKGSGDIATRWKVVTAINTGKLRGAVPEGKRNGTVAMTTADKLASYKTVGLEDYVTFEAVNAAVNFEDIRATMAQRLLWANMIQEERLIFGGNGSAVALGTTPTPTVANAASGGSIAAATYNVYAVALTHAGWLASDLVGGVPGVQTVTMPDGTTYTYNPGTAQKSTAGSTTTTGSTSTISASVTAVNGAVAYAWYVGTSGNEKLEAITTINSVKLTALAGTGQALSTLFTADRSQNAYEFDGLLNIGFQGGTVQALATGTAGTGTKLAASNNDGAIDQVETLLKSMWDLYRLSPNVLYVSSQEVKNMTALVIKNGGSPIVRMTGDFSSGVNGVVAGSVVGSYLNRYSMNGGQLIQIALHPDAAPGTIMAHVDTLPYPAANVSNVVEMHLRQDYYQIDWPITKRQYESGVYFDGVLAHYFPSAIGLITNIADGV
jgi:hypothetical protein